MARSVSSATSAASKLHPARGSVQAPPCIPIVLLPLARLEVGEPATPALEVVVGTSSLVAGTAVCNLHAPLREGRGHRLPLLAPRGGHGLVGGKGGPPEVWPRWRQARCPHHGRCRPRLLWQPGSPRSPLEAPPPYLALSISCILFFVWATMRPKHPLHFYSPACLLGIFPVVRNATGKNGHSEQQVGFYPLSLSHLVLSGGSGRPYRV